ncbi:hypothetical protein [Pantoea cypripedii]|uniref:hypothetical protein n=1 Tax=Pantoea cypripedii TaxID=55209 RepID=UPI001ABF5916|nr:hypothetical protein [Pantoea cypripedii]
MTSVYCKKLTERYFFRRTSKKKTFCDEETPKAAPRAAQIIVMLFSGGAILFVQSQFSPAADSILLKKDFK